MNKQSLGVLILLNVVLLVALLVMVAAPPPAEAQSGFAARNEYLMFSGRSSDTGQELVYIVDTREGKMLMLTYASNNNRFEVKAGVDIARDLAK